MIKNLFTSLFFFVAPPVFAQDENLRYTDHVYLPDIHSVKFHVDGLLLSMPTVNLGGAVNLVLSFDDLSGEEYKDYVYTIQHCNANWEPSSLLEAEYIDGFTEELIENYEYSFKTKTTYTHYSLYLPNEDMTFTKSGNYLLKVYENEAEKRLALTRRFMVVEPLVSVIPDVVRPAMVSKSDSHQEIDFRITHKGFEIRNPRQELSVVVLQNGRWDNAVTGLQPMFSRQEEQIYDYQDKVVFPAGKEFRYLDLRSLRYPSENVEFIDYNNGVYDVTLRMDKKRSSSGYLEFEDINGNYVIESLDDNDHDLRSDYANVLFSLYSPSPMTDQEVYIFGALTDWELKPAFKMVFNPAISAYVAKVRLKQGYYNYIYAALPKGKKAPDFEETEGDWHETRNTYTVLTYYRPFGGRFDRLIGVYNFSSRL